MSQFWNTATGPTRWDVLKFWDRAPRYLRLSPRPQPPPFGSWTAPEHLTLTEAFEFTQYLRSYYNDDSDWFLDPSEEWITAILEDPDTIALAVRNELGNMVGSIVCRSIGKRIHIGSKVLPTAYVIEGLCIHPSWRGRHLAGWLIAWIDHLRNAEGPRAFFWSREAAPKDMTYIASHTYGYVNLESLTALGTPLQRQIPEEIPWSLFRKLWAAKSATWSLEEATFPTILPNDPLRVWRYPFYEEGFSLKRDSTGPGLEEGTLWRYGEPPYTYIVVSDTRRRTRQSTPIWEVAFAGTLEDPLGGLKTEGGRRMLEAVGRRLGRGILFATSAVWQGGISAAWPAPWVFGTAGVHTTYIYNYMPPAFHRLATLFLRNEL